MHPLLASCQHSLFAECCAVFGGKHCCSSFQQTHMPAEAQSEVQGKHFPPNACPIDTPPLSAGNFFSRTHASYAPQMQQMWRPAWAAGASSCSGTVSCACTSTRWRACCAPMLLMGTPLAGDYRTSGWKLPWQQTCALLYVRRWTGCWPQRWESGACGLSRKRAWFFNSLHASRLHSVALVGVSALCQESSPCMSCCFGEMGPVPCQFGGAAWADVSASGVQVEGELHSQTRR